MDYAEHLVVARAALKQCEFLFGLVASGQEDKRPAASEEAAKALKACLSLAQWVNIDPRKPRQTV